MPKYKTLGMVKNGGLMKDYNDYRDGGGGAVYLLEAQRGPYLVTLDASNRLERNGTLLDTTGTSTGHFIFVMDGDGRIFAEDKVTIQHHSAFLAGGPVAAAGFIKVVNGQVTEITNSSGHYMPPYDYTEQALTELKRQGHDVSGVTRNYTGLSANKQAKAYKKAGQTIERMAPKGTVKSRV